MLEVGITSTPVIDKDTHTIYFTTFVDPDPNNPAAGWSYWLHAVDLVTHEPKFGGLVEIEGSVKLKTHRPNTEQKTTPHQTERRLQFVPRRHLQRPGLLLTKDNQGEKRIVVAFGSHGDQSSYQGWVFSYSAKNLKENPGVWASIAGGQKIAVMGSNGAGIWQSGMGLTADDQGSVYVTTGNGTFDPQIHNFAQSVLKLELSKNELSENTIKLNEGPQYFFTPCHQEYLSANDLDIGSSGLLHLPGANFFVTAGKEGRLYLLDGHHLGGYKKCQEQNVLQEFMVGCLHPMPEPCGPSHNFGRSHIHGSLAYWRSDEHGPVVYLWGENDALRAFPFNGKEFINRQSQRIDRNGCADPNTMQPWAKGPHLSPAGPAGAEKGGAVGMSGGMISISANGGKEGIVWTTVPVNNDANRKTVPGILRAYDANDLTTELWDSYMECQKDQYGQVMDCPNDFGNFAKHTPPTIANGKVYVATFSNHVSVYGLEPPPRPTLPPNLIENGGFENGSARWSWSGDVEAVTCYPYYQQKTGRLISKYENGSVSQMITARESGTYLLAAYCTTDISVPSNQPGVTLQVSVDGKTTEQSCTVHGKTVEGPCKIMPYTGYQKYSITFRAEEGKPIKIEYTTPKRPERENQDITFFEEEDSWQARIDAVSLIKISTAAATK
jgi:hypothetical protein